MKPPPALAIALDMLFTQAAKSHLSLYLLGEHGQVEDMATVSRRLLELAATGNWIASGTDESAQERRAKDYLLDLLDSLTDSETNPGVTSVAAAWRELLIEDARERGVKPRRRRKPNFKAMFSAAGHSAAYDTDYGFLSAIAHGSPDSQILQYSQQRVNLSMDAFVPVMLLYGTRYYLAAFGIWNSHFQLCDEQLVRQLIEAVDVDIRTLAA